MPRLILVVFLFILYSSISFIKKIYGSTFLFFVGEGRYKINKRPSFFSKVSNLLSDAYKKRLHYPVRGIQRLAGATNKFDW